MRINGVKLPKHTFDDKPVKTGVLNINLALHKQIAIFCKTKGYKIYVWVEKVLTKELIKENEKNL